MKPKFCCGHDDATRRVEFLSEDWMLCLPCLLKMLQRMEQEEAAYGELATEVIQ